MNPDKSLNSDSKSVLPDPRQWASEEVGGALADRKARLAADGAEREAPRDLKCTLTAEEFRGIRWAAMRSPRLDGQPGSLPMAEFYRRALMEALRQVVTERIHRGERIPPNIAALVDSTRQATKPSEPSGN